MNLTSLSSLINTAFAAVGYVNSIYTGDCYDRWNNADVKYISACYALETADATDDIVSYNLIIYAADRLNEGQSNTVQCFDTCQTAIESMLNRITDNGLSDTLWVEGTRAYTPFVQKFADNLAGVYVRVKISSKNYLSKCNQ